MNLDLSNKNALVGGSSKGIGCAVAIELAALGANVTLVARSADKLAAVLATLDTSKGQKHDFLVLDYSDAEKVQETVANYMNDNNKVFHILINNTGGPASGLITEAKVSEFLQAYNNHLVCSHLLSQTVLEGMKKANYGRIINVISTSVKAPIDNLGVSNTTRWAMAGWAKTWSNEVGKFGITVNNVLPGFTATDRLFSLIGSIAKRRDVEPKAVEQGMRNSVPMARFAEPKEVANVVAFLASPAASYVNGINVPVDGGRTRSL